MFSARKKVLGPFFKKKRTLTSLSQLELARALGYQNGQIVSNWERGLTDPPTRSLRHLVRILNIDDQEVIELILTQSREYWTQQLRRSDKKSRRA